MSEHLTVEQLEWYRNRTLQSSALLAADDHLASCSVCRERAAALAPPVRQLRQSLSPQHLTEEQIEAYAERSLSDPEARAHLQECAACLAEAEDLRQFVSHGKIRNRNAWWKPAAAAAVILIGAGAAMFLAGYRGSVKVAFDKPAVTLPAEFRQLTDEAVKTGRVTIPPEIAALAGKTETQLGTSAVPPLELENPVATGTLSARPEFQWTAAPGAKGYQVSVFDNDGNLIFKSPSVETLSWTPGQDLPSGKTYFWELSATVDGRIVTAPRPPTPQARFLIIETAETERLADIAARFPQEHLMLGVAYAHAGALADARREWQTAIDEGHSEAARLLADLAPTK
jgi:hypothetical protein